MKTMKATFNKILIAGLSLVMALVCMFTVPVRKASASTETENTIPDAVIAAFIETAFAELVLGEGGDPLCLLVDGQFFTQAETSFNIMSTTTLSDLNDSAFMQAVARVLADRMEIIISPSNEPIDVTGIFNLVDMQIIIHDVSQYYLNVTTGAYYSQLSNYNRLQQYIADVPSMTIYGLIVFTPLAPFYNFLSNVQTYHTGTMYAHALDVDGAGNSGSLNVTIHPCEV